MSIHFVGTFEVTSGKVVVSDPCYDIETWCMGIVDNVKNGTWHAYVRRSDEGDFGMRNAALLARFDNTIPTEEDFIPEGFELDEDFYNTGEIVNQGENALPFTVGVDSGQAGIYDYDSYANEHLIEEEPDFSSRYDSGQGWWYGENCDQTLGENQLTKLIQELSKARRDMQEYVNKFCENDHNPDPKDKQTMDEFYVDKMKESMEKVVRLETAIDELPEFPTNLYAGTVANTGVVSSSGFGDGAYTAYAERGKHDLVTEIMIMFMVPVPYKKPETDPSNTPEDANMEW